MLKLTPCPTFSEKVSIPVPGDKPKKVEFIFKHKRQTALNDFFKRAAKAADNKTLLEIVDGWKKAVDDDDDGMNVEFSIDAFDDMLENYPGAGVAIFDAYVAAMTKGRLGN